MKRLTYFEECSESCIKISVLAFFPAISRLTPVSLIGCRKYLHKCTFHWRLSEQFSGAKSHRLIAECQNKLFEEGVCKKFHILSVTREVIKICLTSQQSIKKTQKQSAPIQKVLIWFKSPATKIFIKWHNPFKSCMLNKFSVRLCFPLRLIL